MKTRIVLSAVLFLAYAWINYALTYPFATLLAGNAAGGQLNNSDFDYIASTLGAKLANNLHVPALIVFALLMLGLWYGPVVKALKSGGGSTAAAIALGLLVTMPTPSKAYYDKANSLTEVMDGVGRAKIQSLVCREIGARTMDRANGDATAIMTSVEKDAKQFLSDRGITLDLIGWAGTFTFDKPVQDAINARYAADKVQPVLAVLQSKADIDVKEGLSAGLAKGLPNFLPNGLTDWVGALLGRTGK